MSEPLDTRAKRLFDQTLELDPAERNRVLEQACGQESELRLRVQTLLAAAEKDDAFLHDLTRGPAGSSHDSDNAERVGTTIGPYRLLERLGEGGFGTVFLAEQSVPVRRRVALKVIKFGMDTRSVVARFEQERQVLAMMDHPNIAKVLDAGATATGRPYFVMELVQGRSIIEYCDLHNLNVAERVRLFCQVCRAVQHAHARGIIHRDIKPTNVLVATQEEAACTKVIDFGIAKAMLQPLTEKTILTEQRQLIGTPEYMSPEQAASSPDIDTRTDVYSLGVLLYELLAGLKPFDPKLLRSGAFEEVQRIIREVDPPVPSTRLAQSRDLINDIAARRSTEPRRLGSLLRGELDWIVMKAMEKDRSRRYESPGALAADAERYLSGLPVEAAPPGLAYRVRKLVRRRRAAVLAGALVSAALIVGAAGTTVGLLRATRERAEMQVQAQLARTNAALATDQARRADREAQEARLSAGVAESVSNLMRDMLRAADRGLHAGRADITVREVMDTASRELLAGRISPEPRVEAQLARTIGDTYRSLSLLEPAERMLRISADKQRETHGEQSPEYATALGELGGVLQARGEFDDADASYARALKIAGALGERGVEPGLQVRINAASLASDRGRTQEAENQLASVVSDIEHHGLVKAPEYSSALADLAAVVFQKGDLAAAESLYLKSLAAQHGDGRDHTPEAREYLHNLGVIQFSKGDIPAATSTIREEVEVCRALYGNEHLHLVEALQSLATVLHSQKEDDAAAAAQREAIEIQKKLLGPMHPEVGASACGLGVSLLAAGKTDEAEEAFRTACGILPTTLGPEHKETVYARYQLCTILEQQGRYADAESILRIDLDAATRGLKDGTKYEWMRHAVSSLLGAVLVDEAALETTPSRIDKFREAATLIPAAAERLQIISKSMGPVTRNLIIRAALERTVHFYEAWNKIEPTDERAQNLALWSARLRSFTNPEE